MNKLTAFSSSAVAAVLVISAPANAQLFSASIGGSSSYAYPAYDYGYTYPASYYSYPATYSYPANPAPAYSYPATYSYSAPAYSYYSYPAYSYPAYSTYYSSSPGLSLNLF